MGAVLVAVAAHTMVAFSLVGQRWTAEIIPMEVSLGPAAGLVDGSADWDACAGQSLAAWNAALAPTAVRFTNVRGSSNSPAAFDRVNSVGFADDIFGTPFGPSLLSVTQSFAHVQDGLDATFEADVLINRSQPFNCYRGAQGSGPPVHDLRRTVTHALGHVIGLRHPDAAGQDVTALMNAGLGDVDTLQPNDLQGALTLAGMAMAGIPFPPRNEALTFYESLEVEYRDTLQRSQTNEGYVDAEGSAVWFPEWLRYVLNGCEATEATTRVLMQIRGQGIQPVCSDVTADSYAFPPRNLSLDFLEALDAFYRDELQRSVELSHVDLEGKAVWLQEYLRYRVDGVNDADARSQVLTQIQSAAGGSDPDDDTVELYAVSFTTYAPVVITPLEDSTNLYIYAKNTGSELSTVQGPGERDVLFTTIEGDSGPPRHFFALNPYPITIAPGETEIFEFMTTRGPAELELTLPFTVLESREQTRLTIRMLSEGGENGFGTGDVKDLPRTAIISGTATTSDGRLVVGAEVFAFPLGNMALDFWRSEVRDNGSFMIEVPSIEDIQSRLGDRPLPYDSVGYAIHLSAEGYAVGHEEVPELDPGGTSIIDFVVDPVETRNYELVGELNTGGVYGQWWVLPLPGFNRLAAVQGRHPPELNESGHVVVVDLAGSEIWRFETTNECWGFAVSINGDIAAGCHDGLVSLLSADGQLRWQFDSGAMNRSVSFSPDGQTLITGPGDSRDVVLLDVASGQRLWGSGPALGSDWLRNSAWSPNGERVLTGHAGGPLAMITRDGQLLWEASIGEFPMVLEVDETYNSYSAGKNRELFSFDADGNLRFRKRVANHVVTAGTNNMNDDGTRLALGTVGGVVQLYDSQGNLIWQRRLPGEAQGHNALDMTPDGSLIVVGTNGSAGNDGFVSLLGADGGVLWQQQFQDGRDLGTIPAPVDFDHNHRGAISVSLSDDGRYIVAGFGDSAIRIFEYTQ